VLLGVADRTGRWLALLPAALLLAQLGWLAADGWSPHFGPVLYLLLPVVLGLAARTGRVVMLLVAPLILVQLAWWAGASPWEEFDFAAQLPAFCIGILACHAVQAPGFVHIRRLPPRLLAGAGVMVFIVMVAVLPQMHGRPYGLWRLAQPIPFVELAALLCLLLSAAPARLLVNRVTVALGRVSYSMYLVHFALLAPAFAAAGRLVGRSGTASDDGGFLALYFGLVLIGAFLAASVTFRLVEQPGMELGRHMIRRYRLGATGAVAVGAGGLASR
jgi:peptidoglycan/LPS O-acetylase OafA/YrhL